MRKALGDDRLNYLEKRYRKHGDAARDLFSYMNISDVLRLAKQAGTVQVSEDFIQQARDARNAAAHPPLALVTSYNDVPKIAHVKRETLRLLGILQGRTVPTPAASRSVALAAGRSGS